MKTSPFLSVLLIEDLTKYSGIRFTYPDRLTRDEAKAVAKWAAATPEVARMLSDKSNVDHKAAMLFHDMVQYYGTEHPLDVSGAPEAWPERANRPQAIDGAPFSNLFPDEARDLHLWAQSSPEYLAVYNSASHPQHKGAVERTQALLELANRAEGAEQSLIAQLPQDQPAKSTPAPATNAASATRLAELRADPAYLDAKHPNHKAAVDAVTRVYAESAGSDQSAATPASTVSSPRAGSAAQQQIGAKRADMKFMAAYFSASDPGHGAAVAEMKQLYAEAYPNADVSPSSAPEAKP